MNRKTKSSLKVDDRFLQKLKELRRQVFASGGEVSLAGLTKEMAREEVFKEIEKKILKPDFSVIRFDTRRRNG